MTDRGDFSRSDSGPLRARILAGLFTLLAAFLLAALIIVVQRSAEEREAAQARKQHSFNVILLTGEVDGAMARAEAALGRAIINTDRAKGTLFYDEWQAAGSKLSALRDQVRDDPPQLARVDALQALYNQRGEELRASATRLNYKQNSASLAIFGRAARSDDVLDIALLQRQIVDTERAQLDKRDSQAAASTYRSNRLTQMMSITGAVLMLSAIAAGWMLVTAMNERRIANEETMQELDRAFALERAVAERTEELSAANRALVEEAATREEAETKLRQIQKMEAVGQLTGGIAHDFNNMLAVVIGGLELARKRVVEQAAEASRHIESAMDGATRAAALTRRLLTFARAEPLMPHATDAGQLIHGMQDLIDRTIGERIEVRIKAEPDLWPVWIDPYQLENAILNLCVNARDAMAGAGILEMSAANARLREGAIGVLAGGDYVRIAVTDNGKGMSQAVLERVFEPFFTTKPVGEGTGLGLSQIFGFARQSGGDVILQSREGVGTTVSLYLPRHKGEVTTVAETTPLATPFAAFDPVARETILVVEDDVRVRSATGEALTELGYHPLLCGSGDEAMILLDDRDDIRLMITDVLMPGMTGPELVRIMRPRFPHVSVLFVTGYVGEAGETESFAGHEVLRKPYTLAGLSAAVAAAMMTAEAVASV
ncbi:response regulator [Sphingomonas sp. AP4-R1]|uniref:ATP-binding protein n=1 Tax=Sphingomonas sp. AP4-R1 TaxID=2735134 RepID=UPI001493AC6E|nr:ATP-binding protein [Sphingomonas sp. AP4-R1]QJU56816.1 response regulator [Sphingomonas sp. AP4-R1]